MISSQFTVHTLTGTSSSQSKNITGLLKKRLPANVLRILRHLGALADEYGVAAYLVGGCVRDILLGVKNLDLDITIEGRAIKFAQFLQTKTNLSIINYQKFGTATLNLASGFKIDLASTRRESYPGPAALPQVSLSNIQDDLKRRDFSINTLAVWINPGQFGQLLDFFQGRADLAGKRTRVLHAQSFIDDPTRILRAIRFEQRYNFKIEPGTFKLMRQAISAGLLKKLSRFRLGREFILLLKEKSPLKVLLRLDRLCGIELIHPLIKLDQATKAGLKSFKREQDWLVYFAFLTRKLNREQLERLCRDFCLSRQLKQKIYCLRKEGVA